MSRLKVYYLAENKKLSEIACAFFFLFKNFLFKQITVTTSKNVK